MIDLTDRVAVITGVGSALGQGAASARKLSSFGAAVVICDVDFAETEQRAAEINAVGGRAVAVRADVRIETDVEAVTARAVSEFGRIDILHSQAANLRELADPGDADVTRTTVEMWRSQFETIALGSTLFCKHVIPHMLKTGTGGSIICTTSVSGSTGEGALTTYGSAKAAVNQLVRAVAAQWGKQRIRCNAIAPGIVLTAPSLDMGPEGIDMYTRHGDLPYVAEPEDIANLVAFLASDASRAITGQVICIDSGFTTHSPMLEEQRATQRLDVAALVGAGGPADQPGLQVSRR
jgi:NAD(P)-dependent dehydrogenase (short-subunit alcohol dehydrogenase family)